jgi:hypothetical protein
VRPGWGKKYLMWRLFMKNLNEIKKNRALVQSIDWDMTPEEAIRLYLEWGNNWSHSNYVIKSKDDITYYFVLNTWDEKPVVYLVRRNSEDASELARVFVPDELIDDFLRENKGVYAVDGEIRQWLMEELDAA